MTKRGQTTRTKSGHKKGKQARSGTVQRTYPKTKLLKLSGDLMGLKENGAGGAQTAWLNDLPLQTAQRQALAAEMGRVQGNQYLQRFMQNDEVATDWANPQQTDVYTPENLPFGFKLKGADKEQRWAAPDSLSEIWEAYKADPGFGGFLDREKIEFIRMIVDSGLLGNKAKQSMIYALWASFGDSLLEIAAQNFSLWERCAAWVTIGLDELPAILKAKKLFERDVKATAHGYLARNKSLILAELESVGLAESAISPDMGGMSDAASEQMLKLDQLQHTAQLILSAKKAMKELRDVPVGKKVVSYSTYTGKPTGYQTIYFHPTKPPQQSDENMASWESIKPVYDALGNNVARFANRHPALYAVIEEGNLEELTEGGPQQARAVISQTMQTILENIAKTSPKVDEGDFWLDLKPIHEQLMAGKVAPGEIGWNNDIYRWVAKDTIKDHEAAEFWKNLGLNTLAAAAFLVAELATAGSATFLLAAGVGMATTGYQISSSWEHYSELARAADTEVSKEFELVSEAQVEAALLGAILDTVFGIFDVVGPMRQAAKAARAGLDPKMAAEGAKKAAVEGLEGVGDMADDEAKELLERSIHELGVGETARRAGKEPEELLKYFDEDVDMHKRITAYGDAPLPETMGREQLDALLPQIGRGIDSEMSDQIVAQAIEEFGPAYVLKKMDMDWNKLAPMLGEGSRSGNMLLQWRDNVLAKEIQALFPDNETSKMALRTGSIGKLSNDFDWNFLGANAVKNRDKVVSYLSGRTGMSLEQMKRTMAADFFTDPRRLILYEKLPPEWRDQIGKLQAVKEEQMIWNIELAKAQKGKNPELADYIQKQMDDLGIPKLNIEPPKGEQIRVLEQEVDRLHAKFERAKTDVERAQIAQQIADKQAFINVANEGAYFSGGAVRQYAIGREKHLKGWLEGDPLDAQLYSATIDQMPHLHPAIKEFEKAVEMGDFAKAMRAIGKYGQRMTELANKGLSGSQFTSEVFEELEMQFTILYGRAKANATSPYALKALLDDQFELVTKQTKEQIEALEGVTGDVLKALREKAGLSGIQANVGVVQDFLRLQVYLIKAKHALYWQLTTVAKALGKGMLPEVWDQGDAANQSAGGKKQTMVKK